MAMTVSVLWDGSSATYEVKHEIDGIYQAALIKDGFQLSFQFPVKIILIKSEDGWTSDCPTKALGLMIGQKISEQESPLKFRTVKAEVKLPDNEPQNTHVVPCRILIIDDDKDDVAILSEAFSQCGVDSVHYVFSAMQAFIYLQGVEHSCLPKLIVTDLYLPGISGAVFLKDLKGMNKYKHIHVIVLSSNKTPKEVERFKQMGADDYLLKPSTYEEYVQVAADMKSRAEL